MPRVTAVVVQADAYADAGGPRLAVDVITNGTSLAAELDAAPYGVDEVRSLGLDRRWLQNGESVPLFNCLCGDPDCGGIAVDISVRGRTVQWTLEGEERVIRFDRDDFARSLRSALAP